MSSEKKRKYSKYADNEIELAKKLAQTFGIPFSSKITNIPVSTIRSWINPLLTPKYAKNTQLFWNQVEKSKNAQKFWTKEVEKFGIQIPTMKIQKPTYYDQEQPVNKASISFILNQ